MRSAQTGLFIVACIVALVIGFLFAIITAWQLLYNAKMTKCCEKTCNDCSKCLKYKKCLDITLKLINAVFLIIAVVVSSKTKGFFRDLADGECSDESTNKTLTEFSN
jgi:Na+/H+-translocating membrane pyrophosphatase